jgi:tetratricopeptide (TPR) repeat protein
MAHAHSHTETCSCDHEHSHDHHPLSLSYRWLLSGIIIVILLVLLRSFIIGQMLVRVTSYSANASYSDAVRICQKIITIDPHNIQAWTSLGYAYMDLSKPDMAITAFNRVLLLNPENKGAASFELGQAYYAKGDDAKAIEYFERVRSAGPRASALLDADILKYRHGTLGFRSLNSMQTLLGNLLDAYKQTGNTDKIAQIQKEYDLSKFKHHKVLF